ncbi:DUF58 domain-containing protein [Verminephrobacter aporrectodeae]|uniref:DUF58 domain-containing protein n=1 Tax=Verminephrobacter aporrectodeae TaxID=1110389 RepID=UPI002243BDC9|nr:DUF58 domain-containing protein [Verminephrobacter aporrectodeae]MCW8174620.1 DUF58 domain-containing protein [Verminephrobacter aporrectodeae subsp. tuberculatae]MCW8203034.1 DUF58 domain-containing protein [Verminephrobacter aporrectodeae subsp. tuberculatae]
METPAPGGRSPVGLAARAILARLDPLAPLRQRFQRWWQARLPLCDTLLLTQRNVYILPTGAGWMLALTLSLLLVASINFQLNLGYLFTFLLAGSAVAGMYVCHANLRGIILHLKAPEAHFLGSSSTIEVQLSSARSSPRHGIALCVHGAHRADLHWAWTDVPAQGQARVQVSFRPTHRGLHRLPPLMAETRFPFGSFRVWAYWRPAAQVLVYPAPEMPAPPLPPGEPRADGNAPAQGVGEFDGVRAYRRGDALKLVVWKKAARTLASGSDELLSRDAQQAQRHVLWLDPARAALPDPEARIARLTAWVLQADRLGLSYGLRLPGVEIAPDAGAAHRRRCLEALALC